MAIIFGPDTFTVGADVGIAAYPATPDYAYSRGSGTGLSVIAANDNVQAVTDSIDQVARCIDAAVSASMGDQEAQCNLRGSSVIGVLPGLAVRYSTTTRGYILLFEITAANEVAIYEDNAGFTLIASADRGLLTATTYAASFRATGGAGSTNLTAIIGGTTAVTFNDTTAPATGAPGLYLFRSNSAIQANGWVDDFAVEDLIAAGGAAVVKRQLTTTGMGR